MSDATATAVAAPGPQYPARFDVEYPEELSRLLIFVKWLLILPVWLVTSLISSSNFFFGMILIILFRGRYPRWLFDFQLALTRFNNRSWVYFVLLRDEYPALEDAQAVTLDIDYPEKLNNFLPLVKWLLAIPHFIILIVLNVVALVVVFIAWFAILFTGNFPKGLFDFVVGVQRWNLRVSAYALYLMTDEYPPFSLK